MVKWILVAAALLGASSAHAVSFTSSAGAPDPGGAAGETVLVDFESASTSGFYNFVSPGNVSYLLAGAANAAVVNGSYSGYAAAPALDTTKYMALGTGGSATFDFSSIANLSSLSVYVGSIDTYNYVEVLSDGNVVGSIGGASMPPSNGDWYQGATNRRLFINWDPSENVNGLRFLSTGVAFEFDTIAGASASPLRPSSNVPEPASWAMFMLGFGLLGAGLRRKRTSTEFA